MNQARWRDCQCNVRIWSSKLSPSSFSHGLGERLRKVVMKRWFELVNFSETLEMHEASARQKDIYASSLQKRYVVHTEKRTKTGIFCNFFRQKWSNKVQRETEYLPELLNKMESTTSQNCDRALFIKEYALTSSPPNSTEQFASTLEVEIFYSLRNL